MNSHTNGNFGPFTYDAFGFGGLDVNNTIRNITTTNRAVPIGNVHNSTSVGIDALSPQADEILALKVFSLFATPLYPSNYIYRVLSGDTPILPPPLGIVGQINNHLQWKPVPPTMPTSPIHTNPHLLNTCLACLAPIGLMDSCDPFHFLLRRLHLFQVCQYSPSHHYPTRSISHPHIASSVQSTSPKTYITQIDNGTPREEDMPYIPSPRDLPVSSPRSRANSRMFYVLCFIML